MKLRMAHVRPIFVPTASLALLCIGLFATSGAQEAPERTIDFGKDLFPLLKGRCISCHQGDGASGGLRMDSPVAMAKGGVSGPLVAPGTPAKSILLQRLKGLGGKPQMPMGFKPLDAKELALVELWIKQGGKLSAETAHWAYQQPFQANLPTVSNPKWVRGAIDAFVLAKLDSKKLAPSPLAPKETLLRRVYLDLIGIPPTPAQQESFLKDTRPNAYELLVDQLLASPAYGEKWATMWLDLARYADSNGYEKDQNREMWPYRDWVIKALNSNMPFDEFTIAQIAGDLLPEATQQQIIATGFHRNTMYNDEGGVDKGEQRWLTLVDRVGTTGTVWLGQTIACAQCHDHKYDPISMRDFYAMLAFFEPSEEPVYDLVDPAVRALNELVFNAEKALENLKADSPEYKAASDSLQKLKTQIIQAQIAGRTLVLKENTKDYPPKTAIRLKGSYLNPGKVVTANTPTSLPRMDPKWPANRLGLAKWLVSRGNPLTARVQVNRIWEQIFGYGIVKTVENFGTQGEAPTNQPLLDWLAVQFMNEGWDQKKVIRSIVLSNTYRQSSACSKSLLVADPENRLLARGPRFRMSAEMIRDTALAEAGMLSEKMGGPSVFPDQPAGVWNTPYNGESWQTSMGEDKFRRGVYTFLKRTSPYPSFLTFDSSSREQCTARRLRTNTPLQSLVLMNDEVFVAVARKIAADVIALPQTERISTLYRVILARTPSPMEAQVLQALIDKQLARYQKDADSARKLLKNDQATPELAALFLAAQTLLNTDEAITKE